MSDWYFLESDHAKCLVDGACQNECIQVLQPGFLLLQDIAVSWQTAVYFGYADFAFAKLFKIILMDITLWLASLPGRPWNLFWRNLAICKL